MPVRVGPKEFYRPLSGHRGLSETGHLLIPVSLWQRASAGSFLFHTVSVPVILNRAVEQSTDMFMIKAVLKEAGARLSS